MTYIELAAGKFYVAPRDRDEALGYVSMAIKGQIIVDMSEMPNFDSVCEIVGKAIGTGLEARFVGIPAHHLNALPGGFQEFIRDNHHDTVFTAVRSLRNR